MASISRSTINRLGFIALGLTNNFVYIIMLAAAHDLLNQQTTDIIIEPLYQAVNYKTHENSSTTTPILINNKTVEYEEPFCNAHSTSTILLADTVPALIIKIIYPFLLVSLPSNGKAITTALLATAALTITGLASDQILIFLGVICASLAQGFGESAYLGSTPLYGDASLTGWCMGTGVSGLMSSMSYALLRMILPIKHIMLIMLIVPVFMLVAYFKIIKPIDDIDCQNEGCSTTIINININKKQQQQQKDVNKCLPTNYLSIVSSSPNVVVLHNDETIEPFNSIMDKVRYLPELTKYFLPILLVYFAEYFINQGLFELIYYPEVGYLNHAAQYRWFLVSYQLGVMISRSSLDFIKFKNIWAMSLLQFANTLLFAAHASKLIHLPSFYLVIAIIVYEGLLGGLTFVNGFYRVKSETPKARQEFSISTVTIAENLGIVMAGLSAIPAHQALCKLHDVV